MTTAGVIILSPDALLVRLIEADIRALLFWRCLLTAVMMSVFLFLRYRGGFFKSFFAVGRIGIFSALTITAGSMMFVNSLKQTSAANALIILAATPVISSPLSWIFLREKVPMRTRVAIFTCFGGILSIFAGSLQQGLLTGDLLALGATTMWGANIVIIRSGKEVNMIPANVLGNLMIVLIVFLLGANPLQISPSDAGTLLVLGGLVLPVSFALITLGPRYLQAPEVSLILLAETILGPFWVWLVLHEVPHPQTLLAGVLIVSTLMVHTLLSLRQLPKRLR